MVPTFLGGFTPVLSNRPHDWCKWADPARRKDMPQSYGSGEAALNSTLRDMFGIGRGTAVSYEKASTLEGSLKLPVGELEAAYLPTTTALDLLTHTSDTRLQPKPERYFR
jgi:hypothetical protein